MPATADLRVFSDSQNPSSGPALINASSSRAASNFGSAKRAWRAFADIGSAGTGGNKRDEWAWFGRSRGRRSTGKFKLLHSLEQRRNALSGTHTFPCMTTHACTHTHRDAGTRTRTHTHARKHKHREKGREREKTYTNAHTLTQLHDCNLSLAHTKLETKEHARLTHTLKHTHNHTHSVSTYSLPHIRTHAHTTLRMNYTQEACSVDHHILVQTRN